MIFDRIIDKAKSYVTLTGEQIKILKHDHKSILYHKETVWIKKGIHGDFNVLMGRDNIVKVYDLVGGNS